MEGYNLVRLDRTCHGGGVSAYTKEEINFTIPKGPQKVVKAGKIEAIVMVLAENDKTAVKDRLVLIVVYRPPSSKADWFDKFNSLLLECLSLGEIVVLGDLNSDLIKSDLYPGKELLASLQLANVITHSIQLTRIAKTSATCMDVIATSRGLNCQEYHVGNISASDHLPVYACVSYTSNFTLKPVVKRSFRGVDFEELGKELGIISVDSSHCQQISW